MVEITIDGDRLHLDVTGWDKVWSFKSHLDIPLAHVTSVRADPEVARGWWFGLRVPGTQIPGVIVAGSYYKDGGWTYYDVHEPDRSIVIELDHEHYKGLVVEVADPSASVALIQQALARNNMVRPAMK